MLALNEIDRRTTRTHPRGERASAEQGVVLPRLLRKPARFLGRLARGNVTPPRFALLTASFVLLGGFAAYGATLGGHMPEIAQAVTARTGFAVNEIAVTGNKEISEIDVLDQLDLTGWTSLVGFDASAARDRIAKLAWVESASVRKVYPDKIEVDLVERKPVAVWQHGGQLSVVDAAGRIIASVSSNGGDLPLIVGAGAPEAASSLMEAMAAAPEIADQVAGYVRVGNRRWDLKLDNGVLVQLPEDDAPKALARLVALDQTDHLLSRSIKSVDMRISDRVVVALADGVTFAPATPARGRT